MTYQDFESQIVELITTELSDECTIDTKPVIKNNGITLHGLVINNGKCNIFPTIYLDYYYKELLEDIPHIMYLDLAIVFYYLLEGGMNETSSILIRNSHMKHWGVDKVDLWVQAQNNTPRLLQSEIRSLTDVVKELLSDNPLALPLEDEPLDQTMYVLTNKIKLYGACCILYKNLLEEFAEQQGCDIYIIPSSVHEVLLVPCSTIPLPLTPMPISPIGEHWGLACYNISIYNFTNHSTVTTPGQEGVTIL